MKKKLLLIAIVALSIWATIAGILYVRQYSSYKNRIHNRVKNIVRINTDEIKKAVLWEFITHPSYFLKSKKKIQKREYGIKLPANLFIYTIKDRSDNTFFCSFDVSDTALFKTFVTSQLNINSFRKGNDEIFIGTNEDKRLTVVYNAEVAAISYSLEKEETESILKELVNRTNMLSASDGLIEKLKGSADQITYFDSTGIQGSANYKNRVVTFRVQANNNFPWQIQPKNEHRNLSDNTLLSMWFCANLPPDYHTSRTLKLKDFTFSADSLLTYFNGYADAEWNGMTTQQDTVITYDYNDDFEKKEILTVSEKKVPDVFVSFRADNTKSLLYLQNLHAINSDSSVSKKIFPFWNLYSHTSPDHIYFTTHNDAVSHNSLKNSDCFFELSIDFIKLKSLQLHPLLNNYIENLSRLHLQGKVSENNQLIFNGIVTLTAP